MRFSCAHIRTSKARQPKQLLTLPRDYYYILYVLRFHPHRDHLQSVLQDDIKSVPAMSLKINTKLQQSIEERCTSSASDTLLRKDEDYSDASQRVVRTNPTFPFNWNRLTLSNPIEEAVEKREVD